MLLDTCSTDSVFNNPALLTNIHKCKRNDILKIVSNGGGSVTYDTIGDFGLIPMPVYYNKNSLANVLSFKQVAALDGVHITVNTLVEKAILVSFGDTVLKFKECNDGLYYLNVSDIKNETKSSVTPYSASSPSSNFCFLNTVKSNKSLYTKKQVKLAELARQLQQHMGFPGNDVFRDNLQNNCINNCPITVDDFNRSLAIFGTAEPILKGRMTKSPLLQ